MVAFKYKYIRKVKSINRYGTRIRSNGNYYACERKMNEKKRIILQICECKYLVVVIVAFNDHLHVFIETFSNNFHIYNKHHPFRIIFDEIIVCIRGYKHT